MNKASILHSKSYNNSTLVIKEIIESLNEFQNSMGNKSEENLIENIKNQFKQLGASK